MALSSALGSSAPSPTVSTVAGISDPRGSSTSSFIKSAMSSYNVPRRRQFTDETAARSLKRPMPSSPSHSYEPHYQRTRPTAGTPPLVRLPSLQSRIAQPLSQHGNDKSPDRQRPEHDRRTHELAGRLALLLHARECCRGEGQCGVANCRVARGVLDHCQECFLADGECHSSCSQAKHLLRHFRICRARSFPVDCMICTTLRTKFAWSLQHVESLTPLFLQTISDQQAAREYESLYGPTPLRRVVSDGPMVGLRLGSNPFQSSKRRRFSIPQQDAAAPHSDHHVGSAL